MSILDEILERRRDSVFAEQYATRGPAVEERAGKCRCCGRDFDYPETLNRFEAFIEERRGDFFTLDDFRGEMCADCGIRTLKNSTWMEIL